MATTFRCPGCGDPADAPPGGALRCGGCGLDYWAVSGDDGGGVGQRFSGVATDSGGALATAWSVTAATGVLIALLGVVAAEVAAVVSVVRWFAQ